MSSDSQGVLMRSETFISDEFCLGGVLFYRLNCFSRLILSTKIRFFWRQISDNEVYTALWINTLHAPGPGIMGVGFSNAPSSLAPFLCRAVISSIFAIGVFPTAPKLSE